MSTAAPSQAESQVQPDEYIASQLATARRRIKSTDVLTAAVLCGILLIGYVLIFTVVDHWLIPGGFSAWTRAIMLGLVLIGVAGIAWQFIFQRLSRSITPLFAARMLDRETESGGALSSLVDLQTAGAEVAEPIQQTIEKRAAVRLAKTGVDEAIDRGAFLRLGTTLFFLVVATCLYAVLSPKGISLLRPLSLSASTVATRTTILDVNPGNVTIPAGGQLEITADIGGVIPETVALRYTTEDRRFVDEELVMATANDDGRFSALITGGGIRGIRQTTTYVIAAGDTQSQEFTIAVDAAPTASVRSVTSRYPAYMRLPDHQTFDGRIDTWEGSDVEILAETNVPVTQARLELCSDRGFGSHVTSHPIDVTDRELVAQLKLTLTKSQPVPRFYRILVEDEQGRTDRSPTTYPVRIRRDAPPEVKLLDPVRDLHVPANAVVPLLIEAEDPDFRLRSVTLHYEINGERVEPGERIFDALESGSKKKWTGSHDFRLQPLDLRPGDIVRYFVAARDNKQPRGSQGRSTILKLTIQAPVSQTKVDDQLARDRKRQKEQRKERQTEADDESESDNGEESPNEVKPGDSSDADTPEGEEGDKSNEENEDGNENDPDGESDPSSDAPGTRNLDKPGDDDDKQPGQEGSDRPGGDIPGNNSDENEPEQSGDMKQGQQSPNGDSKESATDNRALEKIIDTYGKSSDADPPQEGGTENVRPQPNQRSQDEPAPEDQPQDIPRNIEPQDTDKQDTDKQDTDKQDTDKQDTDKQDTDKQDTDKQDTDKQDTDKQDTDKQDTDKQDTDKQDTDKQDTDKQDTDKQDTDKQDTDKQDTDKQDTDKQDTDKQDTDKQDGGKQDGGKQDGDKQDGDKQDGDKQDGGKQDGGKQDGDKQDGDKQDGGKQDGGKQDGGKQDGDKQDGDKQDGDKQDGGKQDGGKQDGGKQDGGKQDGGKQDGDKQDGDKQDGGKQDGGKQDGGKQDGDKQDGDKQDGGKQDGGKQDGDKQDGDKQDGGKQDGGKQDGGKQDGGKQDGGKQDGGKQDGGKQDGGKQDGGKQDGGKQDGGKQDGGKQDGGKQDGGKQDGGNAPGGAEPGGPGQPGGTAPPGKPFEGQGNGGETDTAVDKARVDDAAQAASLALKRLQKDLDRGEVDEKLLEELGWTEDRLNKFGERMRKQLEQRGRNATSGADALEQKRVEELLKSLKLNSKTKTRRGTDIYDREQQDTEIRRSKPPARYREWFEKYQRSFTRDPKRRP